MSTSQRISAAVGYIPVIGWIYAFLVERKNQFVMFHLRQAISLVLTLIAIFIAWVVVAWILFAIPFGGVIAFAIFTLPMAAMLVGVIAWMIGIINALRGLTNEVPLFGSLGRRLPL
jgi:uncharacterized membrane protein